MALIGLIITIVGCTIAMAGIIILATGAHHARQQREQAMSNLDRQVDQLAASVRLLRTTTASPETGGQAK